MCLNILKYKSKETNPVLNFVITHSFFYKTFVTKYKFYSLYWNSSTVQDKNVIQWITLNSLKRRSKCLLEITSRIALDQTASFVNLKTQIKLVCM